MVRAKRLSVGYGRQAVLRGLSFQFARNQTTVILGPGGSGKSTLLQTLAHHSTGASPWWRGSLEVEAENVVHLDQKSDSPLTLRAQLESARPDQSALETLAGVWGSQGAGVPEAEATLLSCLDLPPETLTSGLRRVIRLTRAVSFPSELLLLDEPDAGLSEDQRGWITRLLRFLRHRRTIVVVTHHLQLAREVSDHALLLVDGAIIESAAHKQFFEEAAHPRTRDFLRLGC